MKYKLVLYTSYSCCLYLLYLYSIVTPVITSIQPEEAKEGTKIKIMGEQLRASEDIRIQLSHLETGAVMVCTVDCIDLGHLHEFIFL